MLDFRKCINQYALNRFLKACEEKDFEKADSNFYRIMYSSKKVDKIYQKEFEYLGIPTMQSDYKYWVLIHNRDLAYERFVALGQLFDSIKNGEKYNTYLELRKKLDNDSYKEKNIVFRNDECKFNKNDIDLMVELLKDKNTEEAFKLFKKIVNSDSLKKDLFFKEIRNYSINSMKEPDIGDSYKYWYNYFINYYYASRSYKKVYQFEDGVKSEILLDIFNRLKEKMNV